MGTKVDKALARLQAILPLEENLARCEPPLRALYREMLQSFVTQGRILSREEITQRVADPRAALQVLKSRDMVVFDETGEPVGAYPFTMQPREHRVEVNGQRVHAMCALDALAVSPMFGVRTQVDSICRVTGEPLVIRQSGSRIENPEQAGEIRFGIIWGAASDEVCCAESLCTEMIFLRDSDIADRWLAEDPEHREVFSLSEAVEFGSRFFVPLVA